MDFAVRRLYEAVNMELVTIVDEKENKYTFKRYQGYPFNKEVVGNVRDQLAKIAHRDVKEDDVLVCVFPKSGTHWLYNTVTMLRSGSLKYSGSPSMMEYDAFNDIEEMHSPRTFGSHLRFRFLPEQMKLGKGKVITITRNPKDILVSVYRMLQNMGDIGYQGTFEGFLKIYVSEECFMGNGSWFSWIKDMEEWKHPNLLCLSFEDFKQNIYENVVKLAKFLEVDHDEGFLQSVAQSVQFDNLRESHNVMTPPSDRWKHLSEDGRLPVYRKGCLLSILFFFSGQVGDWKNIFTVAQSEQFDILFKENVEKMGLKISLK
ncbi:sulfotransferase 4A1-like [Pecten maximus]|uniref:sulfotransferase 4A1-like n=1 Tax=Pecten maximus TaxID=6579 RepID=UPI001458BF39|nr:sulfotransferase 4A1-like [Pecten maximus]